MPLLGIPRSRAIVTRHDPHHDVLLEIAGNPLGPGNSRILVEHVSVTRVQPQTSSGITDLFLPKASIGCCYRPRVSLRSKSSYQQTSGGPDRTSAGENPRPKRPATPLLAVLFNKIRSRSLSDLTRQITPPTKNGHAPASTKSRKNYQSVNPRSVRTG